MPIQALPPQDSVSTNSTTSAKLFTQERRSYCYSQRVRHWVLLFVLFVAQINRPTRFLACYYCWINYLALSLLQRSRLPAVSSLLLKNYLTHWNQIRYWKHLLQTRRPCQHLSPAGSTLSQ